MRHSSSPGLAVVCAINFWRFALALWFVVFSAGTVTAQYANIVLADNPTAYWRLGETSGTTAVDSSVPGGNQGTYLNGVTLGIPGAIPGDPNTSAGFSRAAQTIVDTNLELD